MNYIADINSAWRYMTSSALSPSARLLFITLLQLRNASYGKTTFEASNAVIMQYTGFRSNETLRRARRELAECGLLRYGHPDARRCVTFYSVADTAEVESFFAALEGGSLKLDDTQQNAHCDGEMRNEVHPNGDSAAGGVNNEKCKMNNEKCVERSSGKASDGAARGIYSNVIISQDEYDRLSAHFGSDRVSRVTDELSGYMHRRGIGYSDHGATLTEWINRQMRWDGWKNNEECIMNNEKCGEGVGYDRGGQQRRDGFKESDGYSGSKRRRLQKRRRCDGGKSDYPAENSTFDLDEFVAAAAARSFTMPDE